MKRSLQSSKLCIWTALIFVVACASAPKDNFKRLRMGMDKAEVLEIMGNPAHSGRKHGSDRWVYEYESAGKNVTNYVYFQEGRVSYIGRPPEHQSLTNKGFQDLNSDAEATQDDKKPE